MKYFFIPLFYFFLLYTWGQDYKIYVEDSVLGGSLSIAMDKEIESMLSKKVSSNCTTTVTTPIITTKPTGSQPPRVIETNPCKATPKILGYKIQIYHSNDRASVEAKLREAKQKYPYLSPEIAYSKPTYRVLLGNYFTQRSGSVDLSSVKKKFPGAFLVQWRVWCRLAK